MPRLSSDLSNETERSALTKGVYRGRISKAVPTKSKNPPFNPKIDLEVDVLGDKDGNPIPGVVNRKLFVNNLMTGGTTTKGEPMPLFTLAKVLERGKIPWTCCRCHPEAKTAQYGGEFDRVTEKFLRGTGENGLPKGKICCPDCQQTFEASYDSASFIGKEFIIAVDVEPAGDGYPEKNVISDWMGIN